MRRFFLSKEAIQSAKPSLTGPDVKHIATVLRLKPGDTVVLFDGDGWDYHARIETVTQRAVTLQILDRFSSITEPNVQITVGMALLKGRKMDRIVRQLTELGIHALVPVLAMRSVPKPGEDRWLKRKDRWEAIARESLKQCGRSRFLILKPAASFEEVVEQPNDYDLKVLFHHDRARVQVTPELRHAEQTPRVLALVGPEGGFTADEVRIALKRGFACVSLGPRILKADTAVVAACAILQHTFEETNCLPEKA
jgi:16S rRNA (uracil1498-N3)-methyltransferase